MKTLKVGTKSQADSVLVNSLFQAEGTLQTMRFDMGKYKADVSLNALLDTLYSNAAESPEWIRARIDQFKALA